MDTTLLNALDASKRDKFDSAINALQGDVSAVAARLTIDPRLRLEYSRRIKEMSADLRAKATAGVISWEKAAQEAQQTRNLIMEMVRARSTPLGRAMAEQLKSEGKTLNELVAKKAKSLFGSQANFNSLSEVQKNQIYAGIVESAGKSNPQVNMKMMQLSRLGKGLVVLSIAISVYEIYTADDKVSESGRQIAINSAGIAGAAAGGAMAGLMCGPGAPVCVLIGGFVGGALAAWEMGRLWN
ncbi:hypothetical protein IM311_19090 [Enterobacter cloacae complex sp. P40RS]|uniref:Glycine zipper family protein n=1 Tax=Enterobacter pasteurii TaxID=3029761 RepID=A0ABR9QBG0_9ENTR|nr:MULTISPECIES: hypothetical protein [Enterobacter cloacae complex]MBE4856174.1 hypothetical protein [Enterobacter pasteurii]MBE4864382.1 hypothetical protein [Enterobacter cloacae complex sp. P40C2]MBE4878734.1 hypothetical protein [Enterobacter cloacae complex sp. P40C]